MQDSGGGPGALSELAGPSSEGGPLLLNPAQSSNSVESRSEVSSAFPLRWAVAGAIAVALAMWGLYAWPQAENETAVGGQDLVDGDAENGAASADADDEDDADSQDRTSDTTDRNNNDRSTTTESSDDEDTTTSDEEEADDEVTEEEEPPGPLVGEPTGLGVVIGSFDSGGALRVVSLDTGETFELSQARGRPIGMLDGQLVAAHHGEIYLTDLALSEGERTSIVNFQSGWIDYVELVDDRIWTVANDEDSYRMVAYTADGELVDEIDMSAMTFGFGWPVAASASELVQNTAGGIYRRSDSGFDRLSTGRIRAHGRSMVLVDVCDDRMECRAEWRHIDDWSELDFPAPPSTVDSMSTVAGNDRWLMTTDWRHGTVSLVEIATGREVRSWSDRMMMGYGQSAPISDDGRWLLDGSGIATLVDLDNEREWPTEIRMSGDAVAVFIDLTETAYQP